MVKGLLQENLREQKHIDDATTIFEILTNLVAGCSLEELYDCPTDQCSDNVLPASGLTVEALDLSRFRKVYSDERNADYIAQEYCRCLVLHEKAIEVLSHPRVEVGIIEIRKDDKHRLHTFNQESKDGSGGAMRSLLKAVYRFLRTFCHRNARNQRLLLPHINLFLAQSGAGLKVNRCSYSYSMSKAD